MNLRRFEVALALAALGAMLAWTVITGHAPNPYGEDFKLTVPDPRPSNMDARPAPGQPYNAEAERSLEMMSLDEVTADKGTGHEGSIRYKSSYGYKNIGYTRLTNLNGKRDSDLVTCKVHEAAPWTIWGMMYNRQTNTGRYATDTGGTPDACPIILGNANNEYHKTGSEHWPVNKHALHWSRLSWHTATGARAAALEAREAEHEHLIPRDPDYEAPR